MRIKGSILTVVRPAMMYTSYRSSEEGAVGCGGNEDGETGAWWRHKAGENKERKNLRDKKRGRDIQEIAGK